MTTPSEKARELKAKFPDLSAVEIAESVGLTPQGVRAALKRHHKRRGNPGPPTTLEDGTVRRTVRLRASVDTVARERAERTGQSVREVLEGVIEAGLGKGGKR